MVLWGILLTGFSVICMVAYTVYYLLNNSFLLRKPQPTSSASFSLSNQYQSHFTRAIFFGMHQGVHQWIRSTGFRKVWSASLCYLASQMKISCRTCNFRGRSNICDFDILRCCSLKLQDCVLKSKAGKGQSALKMNRS